MTALNKEEIALLCVLADVEKITVQELADRFEVSKRTIFRDLELRPTIREKSIFKKSRRYVIQ